MTENNCNIVFTGEIVEGEDVEKVKARMASLFKTSAASIDALFKSRNIIIKRNVDATTAQKYVQVIKKAGAICRAAPIEAPRTPAPQPAEAPQPAAASPSVTVEPEEKPAEPSGPRVVAIHMMHKGDLSYAPHVISKISNAESGLNFNKMDIPETSYKQLIAMAVYNEVEDGKEKSKLLLFATTSKRPVVCNADHIDYASFSIDGTKSTIASFRNFLYFLCRQNPSIFVEEATFDFLSGSMIPKLSQNVILKLTTNMGKLIDSGEMEAQT